MANTRDENLPSLLDLVPDVLSKVIPAQVPASEATSLMVALAKTGTTLYKIYRPALDKIAAKQLLTYVLQANEVKARAMYAENPKLLFIEVEALEWASGFEKKTDEPVQRCVRLSPLRAMLAAGDLLMLKDALRVLVDYVDEVTQRSGIAMATDCIRQQCPNGFGYPPSTYNFNPLIAAISNDQQLIQTGVPSDATIALIEKFRKDFMPGVVQSGCLFNLNELIAALEQYDRQYHSWNTHQARLFWCQVVGYLQRLVPAVFAQALCQKFRSITESAVFQRSMSVYNSVSSNVTLYLPLDTDPACRLGLDFAVSIYDAHGVQSMVPIEAPITSVIKNYISQQENDFNCLFSDRINDERMTCRAITGAAARFSAEF